MIDTNKYEGHTPAPWRVVKPHDAKATGYIWSIESATEIDCPPDYYTKVADICVIHNEDDDSINAQLIKDAPLLLEEVKRLREEKYQLRIKISDVKRWMSLAPSVTQQTIDRLFPEDVIE